MKRNLLTIALALAALPAWAGMPVFVGNGSAAVVAGTGTCTPTMPSTILANDILLVVACGEGDDNGTSLGLNTANGFAPVSAAQVADDNDGVEENPECDCRVWWKRAVGADSAPIISDSGDHTSCAAHQFRGVKIDGNPWNVETSGNDGGNNDTSATIPGGTTTAPNVLWVLVQGTSNNATDTANCGNVTNADLVNITERFDSSNTSGLGGGHCIITGEVKDSGTAVDDSTLTMGATTFKGAFAVGLEGALYCGSTLTLMGAGCN